MALQSSPRRTRTSIPLPKRKTRPPPQNYPTQRINFQKEPTNRQGNQEHESTIPLVDK